MDDKQLNMNVVREKMTDEEIDVLTMPKAIKLCRKHGIDLNGNTDLYILKYLLKYELLSKGKTREQTVTYLNERRATEKKRKDALSAVYDETLGYSDSIQAMKDPVIEELNKIFPHVCQSLKKNQKRVMDVVAPVLVLGETGSGKSTFINLLLADDILPCSMLSNTHVICEIRYCESAYPGYRALLLPHDSSTGKKELSCKPGGDKEAFKIQLAESVQAVDGHGRSQYKLVKLFVPCAILKSGMMIVDSPGVGESRVMEEMVMDYVMNAAAFIYVIDSTNAGGMQERVEKLVQDVYKKTLTNDSTIDKMVPYRPQIALFICNKWDEVEIADRKAVLEDTRRKITGVWPGCADNQIIPFSTVEARFIQDRGAVAPRFSEVMAKIRVLLPQAQEMVIVKGYRFLDQYISRCITTFESHLDYIKLGMKERENKRKHTKERLKELSSRISTFFKEQREALERNIEELVLSLKNFLSGQKATDSICKFKEHEIPKEADWKTAAVKVRLKVYESIREAIQEWEKREDITEKTVKRLQDDMETNFPTFEAEIGQLEREMTGKPASVHQPHLSEDEEEDILPGFIKRTFDGLSVGTKVALGIGLSPLILAGIVVRLPYVGIKTLDRFITKHKMESSFKEAVGDKQKLKQVCETYALKTVKSITDKLSLKGIIEEDVQVLFKFIDGQKLRMERQIRLDLDLLKQLKDEERADQDIERVYAPLNVKCTMLAYQLKYFMIMNNPSYFSWVNEIADLKLHDTVVCSGVMSEVVRGEILDTSDVSKGNTMVCVRRQKEKVQYSDTMKYFTVLEAYSNIKKDHIIHCYGLWSPGGQEKRLYQVMEPIQCNLRQYLLTQSTDFLNNKNNNYLAIMRRIVEGLVYLHDKNLVHIDLSLDTVAVDARGNVKLTNISQERTLNITPDIEDGKVQLDKYVHLTPKFFNPGNVRRAKAHMTYRSRDDMYSVGVAMWEIWTGETLLGPDNELDVSQTSELVSGDCTDDMDDDIDDDDGMSVQEKVGQCLEKMRPTQKPYFEAAFENTDMLTSSWWKTMNICLDVNQQMSASSWLRSMKDHTGYPPVTIVHQTS